MRVCLTPIVTLTLLALLVAGCSSEPETGPEAGAALIEEVAAAMGGWEALEAIERQRLEVRGTAWEPHQARFPGGVLELATYEATLFLDYSGPSMRLEYSGERFYPAPGPVEFVEVLDGDTGAVFDPETAEDSAGVTGETADAGPSGERMRGSRAAARQRDIRRMPVQIPLVARESETLTRALDRSVDGVSYEVLEYNDGRNPVELLVDPMTKLPGRVIVLETDPLYGDTRNELVFDDWRPTPMIAAAGGETWEATIPFERTLFLNDDRFREERVEAVAMNPVFDPDVFDIPSAIREMPERGDRVTSEIAIRRAMMGFGALEGFGDLPEVAPLDRIAPGVWLAGGSTHNSLVVEMNDHLIVMGTPLFEERSTGVIEALNVQFPDKPVRYAVVSHFHADHSGGVRAYAALGATIVAHESIVPFLEVALNRPRTIRPDALARSGVEPAIQRVGEYVELSDGSRSLEIWEVPNPHAEGMLMAYVPAEQLVFVSDLYSPPDPVDASDPNARAFFDAVVERNLDVETVVGAHGSTGPFTALEEVMGGGTEN